MAQVKRSGVGGGKREEKTPARKRCENEKHPLIIALDLCSGNEKPTNQHRTTIVPEAPFTSDKIKINTSVVYTRGGGHLGIFWLGMCRPGLQIGTPF